MNNSAFRRLCMIGGLAALSLAIYFSLPFVGEELYQRGINAKQDWHIRSAIRYFTWAKLLSSDPNEAQFEKALCHQLHGDFIRSRKEFEDLLAKSLINQNLKARILNANGVNLFSSNQPDKSIASHSESLKIARLINDKRLEAHALIDLSRVNYYTKGKFDEAKTKLEEALRIGRELKDEIIIAHSLRNIGVVLWWGKGELDRPYREYYKPALELYRKNNDLRSEATMLSNISFIYAIKGNGFESMTLKNQSVEIRERIEDQAGLSESYQTLGQEYSAVRNLPKANEYFTRSYNLAKKIGYRLTQNESETYLAGIYVELGEYDKAIAIFRRILKREKNSPQLVNVRLGAIAYSYFLKGDLEKARQTFEQILQSVSYKNSKDVRHHGALNVNLGDTYMQMGNLDKARVFLKKADDLYARFGFQMPQGLMAHSVVQAELKYRDGKYADALQLLQKDADDQLDLFASTGTNIIKIPSSRNYHRIFSLLLEKIGEKVADEREQDAVEELAFRLLEQRRYGSLRNFIVRSSNKNVVMARATAGEKSALDDIIKISAELRVNNSSLLRRRLSKAYSRYENVVFKEQFSESTRKAIATVAPLDSRAIQAKLDRETALIEYVFVHEKVFALVLTRNDLTVLPLIATRANLKNKVRVLQSAIIPDTKNAESDDWFPIAESLRKLLIKPIEKSGALKGVKRLAIIPSAFLRDLPFALLTISVEGKRHFLIEDYVIFFPPSATFLAIREDVPKRRELISFGRNTAIQPYLSPLKYAVEESRSVAQIFSGDAILEEAATETELKRLASGVSHIHIASHAIAEPDMPLFSRLILNKTGEDDGNLTAREIFELGISADLVTIAACEGAKSFSADSEELGEFDRVGLTEAFLHAGSRSVLASLSPVSDKATTVLMKNFYRNLLEKDKATSLALAQRAMLRGEISAETTHPRYWANFVLIGMDR